MKSGLGTLVLSAINEYSGKTLVKAGILIVNGSIADSPTIVKSGGSIGGHGTTGNVTVLAGGVLSPGGPAAGTLHTDSVILHAHAQVEVQLGVHHADQLEISGNVNLGRATLDVSLFGRFDSVVGKTFDIIDNDGSGPVHGRFDGLAQGARFAAGGEEFAINYHGGDGSDVVLIALGPVPPPSPPGPEADSVNLWPHTMHHDLFL